MTKRIIMKISSPEAYFRKYAEIMNSILRLRKKELDVFVWLLYYYHVYKGDMVKVFSQEVRAAICQSMQFSIASLNNCLSSLRYYKVLVGKGAECVIDKKYLIPYDAQAVISFELMSAQVPVTNGKEKVWK